MGGQPMAHKDCILGAEQVHSFRACLKRYAYFDQLFHSYFGLSSIRNTLITDRMVSPSSLIDGSIQKYVISCFSGWKGSWRIRVVPISRQEVNGPNAPIYPNPVTSISRIDATVNATFQTTGGPLEVGVEWSGTAISAPNSSGVLGVELPYYNQVRFSTFAEVIASFRHMIFLGRPQNVVTETVDDVYVSVGNDFNLFFFLGVPPLWKT